MGGVLTDPITTAQVNLPLKDGMYQGTWSGYTVTLPPLRQNMEGKTYHIKTDIGVRGKNIPVWVGLHNGVASIHHKDKEPQNFNATGNMKENKSKQMRQARWIMYAIGIGALVWLVTRK